MKVRLQQVISNINLPTVIKTAILFNESVERLFVATQIGEIFYIKNGIAETFLDIRSQVINPLFNLGKYEERGLIGLAFHPNFSYNGLFYIHYSVAGTQGIGALPNPFKPEPNNPAQLNLKWKHREKNYNHVDTVEEWVFYPNNKPIKRRTLINLRRPFSNHNGFNSLNFSPETGKLILTTGDGGTGYDPFNLSQNDIEIAGKIIEIDVDKNIFIEDSLVVTRFNELPTPVQETFTVIAKGVRNISGISFQKINNTYIKYIGNVGQQSVESIYSFAHYKPIPVTEIVQAYIHNFKLNQEGFINFGWRSWEGIFPTTITFKSLKKLNLPDKVITYYDEAIKTSIKRIQPLTCYYHDDPRPDKFSGTALTGVKPYMGNKIPSLKGNIIFTDLEKKDKSRGHSKGALAYTRMRKDCKLNDFSEIEVDHDFKSESAHYVCLGTNLNQTELYLGVYGPTNDLNKGTICEIVS